MVKQKEIIEEKTPPQKKNTKASGEQSVKRKKKVT